MVFTISNITISKKKYIIYSIKNTPFSRVSETTAAISLQIYYIILYLILQYKKVFDLNTSTPLPLTLEGIKVDFICNLGYYNIKVVIS